MPNHESLSLLFLLCGTYCYLRFLRKHNLRSKLWIFLGFLSWFLAGFSSWHAIFVILGVTVHALCFTGKKGKSFAVMSVFAIIFVPTLIFLQILWANNWMLLSSQKDSLLHWVTVSEGRSYLKCLFIIFLYNGRYIGPIPTLFSVIWLLRVLIIRINGGAVAMMQWLVASLSVGTILYNLIFFRAAETHPYQQFYLLPFIAIASAMFLSGTYARLRLSYGRIYSTIFMFVSFSSTITLSLMYFFVIYK